MVDVLASDIRADAAREGFPEQPLDCRLMPFDAASIARYRAFSAARPCAPHQSPLFLTSWQEATGADIVLAELSAGGRTVAMLPLEIATSAICRTACFPGHTHANGNQPPADGGLDGRATLAVLAATLRRERPDIDMLALERLAPCLGGHANPLFAAMEGASPNVALSLRLDGGFDAVLERSSGKRKRKKYRSQLRKFEAAGGWRIVRGDTPDAVDRLLAAFLAMKADRFARSGIANVFAEPGCAAFMRGLYAGALAEPRPAFVLQGLEVGGTLRAVTGASVLADRVICDVSAIAGDELAATSPGDFLFFEMIREACEAGKSIFDFSVGDEYYKRLWCDAEVWQGDVYTPLTARGTAVATVSRSIAAMKRAVKSSPLLWSLARKLRRSAAGRDAAPAADAE